MTQDNATTSQPSCNDPVEPGVLSVPVAVERLLQSAQPVSGFCRLPLRDALHRVVYEDVRSTMNVPGHDNSAMDGYALAFDQLPQEGYRAFRVIGTAYAGQPFEQAPGDGECVRIMTGAPLPPGVDCVVIQESARVVDEQQVELPGKGQKRGQNLRRAGEDIRKGATVFPRGHYLKPADLGVLASLGINELSVCRRPRVSFFSTGDELRSLGETLGKGDIYDSNRYSLHGLLRECDVELIDMGVVRDDPDALRQTLLEAAACSDLILTSGGVSVGEADYIKTVLEEIGRISFWKILMKPGRPLTFGHIGDALFCGLPGNPVAVMVTFYQFVVPLIKRLSGRDYRPPLGFEAICDSPIRKNPGRREFQRAIAEEDEQGRLHVRLTGRQGSGILTSMSRANCFIVLDERCGPVAEGDRVRVEFFDQYFSH